MGLLIAGIAIGIVLVLMVALKKSPKDEKSRIARKLVQFENANKERESRHKREWLSVVNRLPIVDSATSMLLHAPIYDCVSDEFELPCLHRCYESRDNAVSSGMLVGFVSTATVHETLAHFSDRDDEVVAFVDVGDHAYLIHTDTVVEAGSKIYRIVRTGSDEFHLYGWRSGMSARPGREDPPYHVRTMSARPQKWIARISKLEELWALNSNYQSALRRCPHQAHAIPLGSR